MLKFSAVWREKAHYLVGGRDSQLPTQPQQEEKLQASEPWPGLWATAWGMLRATWAPVPLGAFTETALRAPSCQIHGAS